MRARGWALVWGKEVGARSWGGGWPGLKVSAWGQVLVRVVKVRARGQG